MLEIGKLNTLTVLRPSPQGLYLGDEDAETAVLLPNKYVPEGLNINDEIEVFIYRDSQDRVIATTLEPMAMVNEFAFLQVREVTKFGAFMDWGLMKDLLVPFREQATKMKEGNFYVVFLYLDEQTDRVVATSKFARFFKRHDIRVQEGEEVDLLVYKTTELGANVIINNSYQGLIYKNELFQRVRYGHKLKGFIKKIREGNKIDVSLQKQGHLNIEPSAEKVLEELKRSEGFLGLNDKSPPQEIYNELQMSKKTFKKAIGGLYKQRLIRIEKSGIYLIDVEEEEGG